jgi:hypothetical protein
MTVHVGREAVCMRQIAAEWTRQDRLCMHSTRGGQRKASLSYASGEVLFCRCFHEVHLGLSLHSSRDRCQGVPPEAVVCTYIRWEPLSTETHPSIDTKDKSKDLMLLSIGLRCRAPIPQVQDTEDLELCDLTTYTKGPLMIYVLYLFASFSMRNEKAQSCKVDHPTGL